MKVIKWLDEHFEETFLVFFLVLISCITMLQIVARTFFAALPWPEEFCRYCWIWSVFISLPYTMRKGNMLRVNVLVDLLPTKARNAINIVIDLINTVVMALFFNGSITVIQNALNSGRTSPAMELPMAAVYICLLIGFGLGFIRGIQQVVLHIMNFNKKELTTLEQAMADAAEEAAAAKGDLEGGAN